MKKIFFTDLDGTLLNDKKEITKATREAINALLEEGHVLVLASGRTLPSVQVQARVLGLDQENCFISAYNGAILYDIYHDKILHDDRLPLSIVKTCFETAKSLGVHAQTYNTESVVVEKVNAETIRYCDIAKCSYVEIAPIPEALEEAPHKVLFCNYDTKEPLIKLQEVITPLISQEADIVFSSESYLEVMHKGVSKGNSLKLLCSMLNIPVEASVSAGDADNDLSMILDAGVGCAMNNAVPLIKDASDYITTLDNNHDGVAEIIRTFILEKDPS